MWGASLISCKWSIHLGTVESPLGGYLIRCRLGSTWCRRYRRAVGRSGAAGEPASGATGLMEALRTGVWSPGSGLKLGAAWPVTWGARPTSVHFRLQSSEPGGSGLDSLQALTFGGSGPPKCLGMMTAWFPSADGRWGCDFPIHLAVTHTHTDTHTYTPCSPGVFAFMILKGPRFLVTLQGLASLVGRWGPAEAAVKFGQKRNTSSKTQACAGGAGSPGQEMPEPRRRPGAGGKRSWGFPLKLPWFPVGALHKVTQPPFDTWESRSCCHPLEEWPLEWPEGVGLAPASFSLSLSLAPCTSTPFPGVPVASSHCVHTWLCPRVLGKASAGQPGPGVWEGRLVEQTWPE